MNRPVRTTTPSGEEIVILPAAEYDRLAGLAEDAIDIAVAERGLADAKAGRGEALTAEEMTALLGAASPIAFWRKRRGLTQMVLAGMVGISQGYLAQIERGKRSGDLSLYRGLAGRLGVGLDDLLPDIEEAPARVKRRSRKR